MSSNQVCHICKLPIDITGVQIHRNPDALQDGPVCVDCKFPLIEFTAGREVRYLCGLCSCRGAGFAPAGDAAVQDTGGAGNELSLGCYVGDSTDTGGTCTSYMVRLTEDNWCWLTCTVSTPATKRTWHVEGPYSEDCSGSEGGGNIRFVVEHSTEESFENQGPEIGRTFDLSVGARDAQALLCEGVWCVRQEYRNSSRRSRGSSAPSDGQTDDDSWIEQAFPADSGTPKAGAANAYPPIRHLVDRWVWSHTDSVARSRVGKARLDAVVTAEVQRLELQPLPPRGSSSNPLLPEVTRPAVHQVQVVSAQSEWGGGMGVSSSSSDDSHTRKRLQRQMQAQGGQGGDDAGKHGEAAPQQAGLGAAAGGVRITQVASEWHGISDSSDESGSDSDFGPNPSRPQARSGRAGPLLQMGPAAPVPPGQKSPLCSRRAFFVSVALLHCADFILRTLCFAVYFMCDPPSVHSIVCLLPIQILGTLLSIYITFHDADVALWLHRRTVVSRFCVAALAFVFLGCFQVIRLKRAYARQLHAADVLFEFGATTFDSAASTVSSQTHIGGSERVTPVALITGVPFLLVNMRPFWRGTSKKLLDWMVHVIWCTNAVVLLTVSFAITEIDISVSTSVLKRSHVKPEGQRRCLKRLFQLIHIAFRTVEVLLRLIVLTGFLDAAKQIMGKRFMIVPLALDYCFGVALLYRHAPEKKEQLVVHMLAGVTLLVADLAHFIDQPNYAAPARRITRNLAYWRLANLMVLTVFWLITQGKNYKCDPLCRPSIMYLAAAVYYALLFSWPIRELGFDLHTAASAGDLECLKRLLMPDHNGQVLDVNAAAKDFSGMMPLMYAAEKGHIDVVEFLLRAGAEVNAQTESRDTCLHVAAARRQTDVCRFLVENGADCKIANKKGLLPDDVVPAAASESEAVETEWLHEILNPAIMTAVERGDKRPSGRISGASVTSKRMSASTKSRYYSVAAAPAKGVQLRNLFPDIETEDAPSPRVLHSVSGFLVSRACGSVERLLLARPDEDASNGVPISALRRVRELGKGGFGHVIEVELPVQPSKSWWPLHTEPRRFALKLQLKRDRNQATSEVLALRRADHPFIVHLERAFSFDKCFALLLELCPTDLNRELSRPNENGQSLGLHPARAARMLGQAALALVHLHTKVNIVFRDVKPDNILIDRNDDAKLTDFGLAKKVTSAERMSMCGTVGFMPPEMIARELGCSSMHETRRLSCSKALLNAFKADAYSFGVTLQMALLGEDAARKRTIRRKGVMMLPLHLNEGDNRDLLRQLCSSGRLSKEAYLLLVDRLLPFNPAWRSCLSDDEVLNHDFFLRELGCTDLEEHLMPG